MTNQRTQYRMDDKSKIKLGLASVAFIAAAGIIAWQFWPASSAKQVSIPTPPSAVKTTTAKDGSTIIREGSRMIKQAPAPK